jgi:hypothetical protein
VKIINGQVVVSVVKLNNAVSVMQLDMNRRSFFRLTGLTALSATLLPFLYKNAPKANLEVLKPVPIVSSNSPLAYNWIVINTSANEWLEACYTQSWELIWERKTYLI